MNGSGRLFCFLRIRRGYDVRWWRPLSLDCRMLGHRARLFICVQYESENGNTKRRWLPNKECDCFSACVCRDVTLFLLRSSAADVVGGGTSRRRSSQWRNPSCTACGPLVAPSVVCVCNGTVFGPRWFFLVSLTAAQLPLSTTDGSAVILGSNGSVLLAIGRYLVIGKHLPILVGCGRRQWSGRSCRSTFRRGDVAAKCVR